MGTAGTSMSLKEFYKFSFSAQSLMFENLKEIEEEMTVNFVPYNKVFHITMAKKEMFDHSKMVNIRIKKNDAIKLANEILAQVSDGAK